MQVQHLQIMHIFMGRKTDRVVSTWMNFAVTIYLLQTLLQPSQGCAGHLSSMRSLLTPLTSLVEVKVWSLMLSYAFLNVVFLKLIFLLVVLCSLLKLYGPMYPFKPEIFTCFCLYSLVGLCCALFARHFHLSKPSSCRSNSKSSPESYEGWRVNYIPCKKPSTGLHLFLLSFQCFFL